MHTCIFRAAHATIRALTRWKKPVTAPQIIACSIVAGLMILFVWNRIRYDLAALLGLVVAVATGIVPLDKAFSGFSDQVVVIVGTALVVSAGVGKSGVIGRLVRCAEPALKGPGTQVLFLSSAVAVLSSIVKNIGALAIFLPVALQLARRSGTSPSTLLMPMAFGSLIGGIVTLVGTSPNILVSRVREELSGEPFAMFDFAPVGLGILAAGLAFLAVGWRLLPTGRATQPAPEDAFKVDSYVTEARLPATSRFVDKSVAALEAEAEGSVAVVAIMREGNRRYVPGGHWSMYVDDILLLQGDAPAIRELAEEAGLEIVGTAKPPAEQVSPDQLAVVEAVVMEGSTLAGRTPAELRLRDRYGVNLVAIGRRGLQGHARLRSTRFKVGDVLILQGNGENVSELLADLGCLPLIDRSTGLGTSRRDYLPLAVLAATIALIATGLVPIAAAFFGAAVAMVLGRVLTLKEAYAALDAPILILLACMIPISDAINGTGAAGIIADGLAVAARQVPAAFAVTLVLMASMAVTPFLNNAATVLIMAPIAGGVAKTLGLDPDPFLMAVAIGAACDFLTPIGHQCNTLVLGPGGYRFGDYWKLGLPLSIIVILVGSLLIPVFWSLTPR
jgi:di/tricarboxylate transporter